MQRLAIGSFEVEGEASTKVSRVSESENWDCMEEQARGHRSDIVPKNS